MKVPVVYKDRELETDFRCDLYVENIIVVELKAVFDIHPMFEAKLLNYMKLLKSPKGILINFNCYNIFNEGQKTYANNILKVYQKDELCFYVVKIFTYKLINKCHRLYN